MKKQVLQLSLAAGLALPMASIAQNTFPWPANGNVGIGTLAPNDKLEISDNAGGLRLSYASEPSLYFLDINTVVSSGVVRYSFDQRNWDTDYPNTLVFNQGRIGVGTPDPTAKLHVNGNINYGKLSKLDTDELSTATIRSVHLMFGSQTQRRALVDTSEGLQLNYANDWPQMVIGGENVIVPGNLVSRGNVIVVGKTTTSTLELTSDRNRKQDFQAISPREILAKVSALPVTTWRYTNSPVPHIGPMAQDFKAAFDLGEDDKHISAGDGIGVALAAIQGLHELVQEKDSEITALKRELAGMKQELASVKDTVTNRLAALEKSMAKNVEQASYARPHPSLLPQEKEAAQASFRPEATR